MFRPFTELNTGFYNAENYRLRQNKELLEKFFVRDVYLDRLLDPNIYFLVGEKGTGKTAYATYLANNEYKNRKASVFDIRQTEYQKFLELKKHDHLVLSQYSEVWRVLLLMAAAVTVLSKSGTPDFLKRFTRLAALQNAINDFYENAFAPEIVKMISFVESSEIATSLIAKYMGLGSKLGSTVRTEHQESYATFQTSLLKLRQAFETALSSVKLDNDVLIFIDGIDVRPSDIAYGDYFECVRGLIEATWSVNNDFFFKYKRF
jgi:hypothetical protein